MRFEVRYPTGARHEVELSGTLAVLGRDPSSDLVLNDPKCSRRHAVIEAGPDGLAIRDAGSANGVYVNGKKTERSRIADGDEIRLGDVVIRVLPEDVPGTLVMAPEDMDDVTTRPSRPAPPPRAAAAPPPPSAPPSPPSPPRRPPPPAPQARAQTPPPAAPPLPRSLEAAAAPQPSGGKNHTLLIVGALGCFAILVLLVVAVLAFFFVYRGRGKNADTSALCAERLRAVASAEDAFRQGTCGAYADMEGLTNPSSVIPRYPAGAPPFLTTDLSAPEAAGCRFELQVQEPVAPSVGCPSRSFRRFVLVATPVAAQGHFLRLGSDGVVHSALGRPASDDDPPLVVAP